MYKRQASVHAEYTSTYPLWDALGEYAYNNHIGMHVHLSETKDEHEQCKERYGLTPVSYTHLDVYKRQL